MPTVIIAFKVPQETKAMLVQAACQEKRTMSNLLRLIVADWEERRQQARQLVDTKASYDAGAGHS